MKKLLFVNDEMTMGGVAKILNNLMSRIDINDYEIDLLVLNPRGELMKEIPSNVTLIEGSSFFKTVDTPIIGIIKKGNFNKLLNKIRLVFYMKTGLITSKIKSERKKILSKKYDVEFAAKEGFCTIFISCGTSNRKINWIQVDYKESNYSKNHMMLMKKALTKIDVNIACSKMATASYKEVFGISNVITINNMLSLEKVNEFKREKIDINLDDTKINLITVARFHKQKALHRILESFALIADQCDLYIVGDGELNKELHALAQKLGIDKRIIWLGMQKNPYKYMSKMDVFLLSSIYEGYPTIVVEALACGIPVLSTDVAGIREQLISDSMGWIVANSDLEFKEALVKIIVDKEQVIKKKEALINYDYDNNQIFCKMMEEING